MYAEKIRRTVCLRCGLNVRVKIPGGEFVDMAHKSGHCDAILFRSDNPADRDMCPTYLIGSTVVNVGWQTFAPIG